MGRRRKSPILLNWMEKAVPNFAEWDGKSSPQFCGMGRKKQSPILLNGTEKAVPNYILFIFFFFGTFFQLFW
ncbi:hypothetical protein POVWA2_031160 [Plasmodium ovale wallikeri]|uniref:Uncharacterized protein n=1 Tax=Plasmodium ovale wallikeri TaxID=864142 RepID=A0A1A8YYN2_PLAOA|nr:hypothetical protein POVWA1_031440 [Plasmodium ovale wallikeri]SBT36637.1 hypothetical protein POVWA2_031160 [Plasmodium ovale wallikeri]